MASRTDQTKRSEQPVAAPTLVAEEAHPPAASALGLEGLAADLGSVLEQGRQRVDRLDAALDNLAASELTVTEIGRRVEALRADGKKRLDRLRADALKRVDEAPGALLSAAAGVAHTSLRSLSKELHAVAERLAGHGQRKDSGAGPA